MALSRLSRDRVQQRLVEVIKIFSRNRFQRRFLELNMSMEVQLSVNIVIMDVSTALLQDRVQQLVVELIFTSCCRRMWWMRSCRSEWLLMYFGWRGPVLWCSSRNGPSCMMKVAWGGLGHYGALASPSSDASKEDVLCQCEVGQQHSHAVEFVGGPLSSLTTIPRLRTFWWCSRLRNLPCSSRMRSKQPRRHSLNDGIMRAVAVLVGERRALVFRYGDLGMVLIFMFIFSCVYCRVGATLMCSTAMWI